MSEFKLSILIPARNEEFLGLTIQNILNNSSDQTEIITVLDGFTDPIPSLPQSSRVKIINLPKSIGQRGATNLACKLSEAKYVMKCDAHVAFDKGFDIKMMNLMQDDITMIPVMRNLHAFDWVCEDGHRRYQGPAGVCEQCQKETYKEIMWVGKNNPQSIAYRFDKNLHFQYWNEYGKTQTGDLTETMSIQGSCFMLTRDKYWELNICDEEFGSWGQQGVEVACKTWLSGGRVLVNRTTWYAHLFRTQPGFGFPYPNSGNAQERARDFSKDLFKNNKFGKAIHDFDWLIKKFSPIPGWEEATKGIIYYTDNELDEGVMKVCQNQLMKVESSELPIISVSLKPIEFGVNFVLPLERSVLTMYKQILKGLQMLNTDVVFFCEHDDLYAPDYFEFTPKDKNTFYYNGNYWFLRLTDGFAIHYNVSPLSGLVVYREIAIKHFKERIALIEKEGFSYRIGFEPFTHRRIKWDFWCPIEIFMSKTPTVDISHSKNVTKKRWTQDLFRRKPTFWEESNIDNIPGWPNLRKLLNFQG